MAAVFRIVKPGLLTTVQDLGRTGYQQYGMVVSGAMDIYALQVGNLLVGNERGEAGLEITIMGPEIELLEDAVIAICGADLSATVDNKPAPLWKSFYVQQGQTIRFGRPVSGARAYITVAGGISIPTVMGSKSTYMKAQVGGVDGRELQKGDVIEKGKPTFHNRGLVSRSLKSSLVPDYERDQTLRVILGPDEQAFHESSIGTFLSEAYEISPQSDRMGYRLQGAKLTHVSGADILSDAIFPGTIQVPASGEPIILLADRQTTGGYTRIGTVISVDLPYLGQMLPGNKISFQAVSIDEAQALNVKREKAFRQLSLGAGIIN
ncbi:biotin-dependent carboxyltransferase family protein [Texcoconibacillus texcoconensis]|uniref:Antagonist of KipI n=1 Tax=Texcoconibacillus texcoconensis TaxID=1095777 RepID=A0A840QMT2_9BACI|nr:biotin-dependent carboxyltransferase family protein [Texcoconibacillus texcoconensis]MBB5172640.1 antagonist of KipI [Texcoconibacillus texcoconensis]